MAAQWIWWVMAAVLAGAELFTGTLYLLACAIAFALGGVAAWLGASTDMQLVIAGLLSVIGIVVAHQWRKKKGEPPQQPALDIGQAVQVRTWHPDGTARVEYRGTQWNAELAAIDARRADTMYIVATRGSTLVLSAQRP
jgi:membrane protein implicated in regulation of membrane protease activity